MTESQWIGLAALAIGFGFLCGYLYLKWVGRTLRRRGGAAVGRVLKVTREWGEGGRGWVSEVEFIDAAGEVRRFDARGRFEGEVGVSYDPQRPTRARVTTSSPFQVRTWHTVLVYSGLSVMILLWFAVLAAGVLLVTGRWELSDEVLFGG